MLIRYTQYKSRLATLIDLVGSLTFAAAYFMLVCTIIEAINSFPVLDTAIEGFFAFVIFLLFGFGIKKLGRTVAIKRSLKNRY